jgi:hypothetical protein
VEKLMIDEDAGHVQEQRLYAVRADSEPIKEGFYEWRRRYYGLTPETM